MIEHSGARLARYNQAAKRLHDHLTSMCDPIAGYPDTPSWGYAFSVLLSAAMGSGTLTSLGHSAIGHLSKQAHEHPNYSWEFVVYAIQQAKRLLKAAPPLPYDEDRSKGTRMLNWFLLRQVNRGWFGKNGEWSLLKLRIAKHFYTTSEGQIVDELRTRSLQYHAFCLFLICELIDQHPDQSFLKDWLRKGARYSISQILADGTALWIGRGQEQIFGYAALIYALEYVHHKIEPVPDGVLDLLQHKVLGFQRDDGGFPLVLRQREPEAPDASFATHPPGWYGYNTLFDYQPFLAYLLWRTAQLGAAK